MGTFWPGNDMFTQNSYSNIPLLVVISLNIPGCNARVNGASL